MKYEKNDLRYCKNRANRHVMFANILQYTTVMDLFVSSAAGLSSVELFFSDPIYFIVYNIKNIINNIILSIIKNTRTGYGEAIPPPATLLNLTFHKKDF